MSIVEESSKWASRKFVITVAQWLAVIILPPVYIKLGLSETILLTVLGSTTTLVSVYTGLNVLQKKVEGSGD